MDEPKKIINVVAAIIVKDGRLFATQRGYGEWKDWWEFPGGKIEGTFVHDDDNPSTSLGQASYDDSNKWIPLETPEEALRREIREELQTEIEVGELLTTVEYDYPKFHLSMQCFVCSVVSGHLSLLEHEDARWLRKDELDSVKWLPADVEILPLIVKRL
ncbi:MAG: (deoxy)nucleoside triphosphate pyrophosphohydrolase [Bacteroidaceae bacterium]|nr:(deoxy)nucleoside triphosphate pyrophosphohydrolase [Bacteroidaceae bacterium]